MKKNELAKIRRSGRYDGKFTARKVVASYKAKGIATIIRETATFYIVEIARR